MNSSSVIEVKGSIIINAPIAKVWKEMTDHKRSVRWPVMKRVEILQEGKDDANGLGCIREVWAEGMYVKEEIVLFESPKKMGYQVLETDLPIIHYGGIIDLSEIDNGIRVVWSSKFVINSKNPIKKWVGKLMIKRKENAGFAKALEWIKCELES